MRYEVTIITAKTNIRTKAKSLREIKSLISGINDNVWILIEDLRTNTYVPSNTIRFWSNCSIETLRLSDCVSKHKLARGIYKSGFIKA
jgi:hypothetical protein